MKTEITFRGIVEAQQRKVYCKGCVHYRERHWRHILSIMPQMPDESNKDYARRWLHESNQCHHSSNIKTESSPTRTWERLIEIPQEKNRDNNCKHYQEPTPWWMFWKK